MPKKLLVLLAALTALPALAQAPMPPQVPDAVLAERLAHCAAAFFIVTSGPDNMGARASRDDARALARLSMLGVHALTGDASGLAAVKREQEALHSKLALTRPENQGQLMDAEFRICAGLVEAHRAYLADKIKQAANRPN